MSFLLVSMSVYLWMENAPCIDGCQYVWQTGAVSPASTVTRRTTLPVLSGCCSPLLGQVLQLREAEDLAGALKAIADPVRLRLISMVASHQDQEACVCDLTEPVGLSQPTVSHHLKVLVDAGILAREQRGKWAYYRLVPRALADLARLIAPHAA
jgi:ArsR family transcriptional regulator, arsenate/arsenite/antimonite-responsive transcriptional repressor